MVREGHVIGAIFVAREKPGLFADTQVELLKTFADQAVIAIENVRLFQELETRTRDLTRSVGELRALGEVSQAVSSTLDLETVLETIVSRAVELSGSYSGIVYEFDETTQTFRARATHRITPDYLEVLRAAPLRLGEGAIGRAGVIREPVQVADIEDESAAGRPPGASASGPGRACAPSLPCRSSGKTGCSAAWSSSGASGARSLPRSSPPSRPSPPSRCWPSTTRASSGRSSVRSSTRTRSWRRARWRSRPWTSTARSWDGTPAPSASSGTRRRRPSAAAWKTSWRPRRPARRSTPTSGGRSRASGSARSRGAPGRTARWWTSSSRPCPWSSTAPRSA